MMVLAMERVLASASVVFTVPGWAERSGRLASHVLTAPAGVPWVFGAYRIVTVPVPHVSGEPLQVAAG